MPIKHGGELPTSDRDLHGGNSFLCPHPRQAPAGSTLGHRSTLTPELHRKPGSLSRGLQGTHRVWKERLADLDSCFHPEILQCYSFTKLLSPQDQARASHLLHKRKETRPLQQRLMLR